MRERRCGVVCYVSHASPRLRGPIVSWCGGWVELNPNPAPFHAENFRMSGASARNPSRVCVQRVIVVRVMQCAPGDNLGDLVWLTDDRLGTADGACSGLRFPGRVHFHWVVVGPGLPWSADSACFMGTIR